MRFISNALHNLYGRHHAIRYRQEFNFRERWQETAQPSYDNQFGLLTTENRLVTVLHLVSFVANGLTTWFFSIHRLFSPHDIFPFFLALAILLPLLDAFLRCRLDFDPKTSQPLLHHLKLHWLELCTLLYVGGVGTEWALGGGGGWWLYGADCFFAWQGYCRFR
jgi:hypothetical protein